MRFNPKEWCEGQLQSARTEIQLKYFVEDKSHLKNLWDGIMVGNSFRESAHLATRAQSQSLIEIHKIIPNFVNDKGGNTTASNNNNNNINKEDSPLEYINYEVSNNLISEFEKLSKNDKSIIMNHLKENYYRISILSEIMKSENELEGVVKEKLEIRSSK